MIVFDNVTKRFPGSQEALSNASFSIEQGEMVYVTGHSGAGKSTLIDMMLGLIKPISGKIYVDNEELKNNIESWQKLIGYVPQDIYLLDDTIRNNIGFGLDTKDINQENILKSIKIFTKKVIPTTGCVI